MITPSRYLAVPATGAAVGAIDSIVNDLSSPYGRLGVHLADTGWHGPIEVASLLLDAGWAWAALALAAGWWIGTPGRGAIAGPSVLSAANIAYFSTDAWARHETLSWIEIGYWCAAAVVLGSVLGAVGSVSRRPGLPGLVARLAAPVGATVQMFLLPPGVVDLQPNPEADVARGLVLALAALVAVAVLVRFVREHRHGDGFVRLP